MRVLLPTPIFGILIFLLITRQNFPITQKLFKLKQTLLPLLNIGMGAKPSTEAQSAGGNGQSSTGANDTTMQSFSLFRSLPEVVSLFQPHPRQGNQSQTSRVSGDSRQRARSLSSVPDLPPVDQSSLASSDGVGVGQALGLPQLDSDDADEDSGRVYAAHSLPSHIWSLNGEFIDSWLNTYKI